MNGKNKCKALKEIRRQIAEENDIPFIVSECTFQGECTGTCPKCESELRYLEQALAYRQLLGKAVFIAGISVSVCASLTSCRPIPSSVDSIPDGYDHPLEGEIISPKDDLMGDIISFVELM